MAPDDELLKKARQAQSQLAEAERQVLLSRAEYHTTVRRLNLAGSSLREIAQALEMSHQRVQQIVMGAGGTWWQRVWRTRRIKRDAVCTFCERPPSGVSKLIAGPNLYICDSCVALAERAMSNAPGTSGSMTSAKKGAWGQCSFCRKRRSDKRPLIIGSTANVCGECLRVCRDILNNRAA